MKEYHNEYYGEFKSCNGKVFDDISNFSIVTSYDYKESKTYYAGIYFNNKNEDMTLVLTILNSKKEISYIKSYYIKSNYEKRYKEYNLKIILELQSILTKYSVSITYLHNHCKSESESEFDLYNHLINNYYLVYYVRLSDIPMIPMKRPIEYLIMDYKAIKYPTLDLDVNLHKEMNKLTYELNSNHSIGYKGDKNYIYSLAIANWAQYIHNNII